MRRKTLIVCAPCHQVIHGGKPAAGPVVVFIHGHPFNRSMWAPQLAALRDSFRVIAPDLRGYGDSPVTAGTP